MKKEEEEDLARIGHPDVSLEVSVPRPRPESQSKERVMGQAFDGAGQFLGDAFGDTKREVLDKLEKAHGDKAAEIRIRSLMDAGASAEMPKYRSHKEVWALKIQEVLNPTEPGNETDGSRVLRFVDHAYAPLRLDAAYVRKHDPKAGGYYVVYKDGYKSFSPAEAFEDGYTRV